jgi:hypothetical protein
MVREVSFFVFGNSSFSICYLLDMRIVLLLFQLLLYLLLCLLSGYAVKIAQSLF